MAGRKPNQPSPKKKTFFKVLESDFSEFSQHLKIPPNFVKNFNGKPSSKCALISTSGTWPVGLETREDGIFFHGLGWQSFVKDHALETGNFLVFSYNSGTNFNVTIFDTSCCEKEIEAANRRSTGSHVSLVNKGKQAQVKVEVDSENECDNKDSENKTTIAEKTSGCRRSRRARKKDVKKVMWKKHRHDQS